MSEPRLISPLLDGCMIGEAISCHNGVRCCPALRQSTGEKYIVKIISVPASQVQLEALLLTGAFENQDAALAYFAEMTRDVMLEKETLDSLSQLEGFTGYTGAQVVAMEEGIGFEVYLLSPYKRSMERIMATDTLTHLSVVNMGLDLCAALAACRHAGYLYVDLKPENIFFTQEKNYRIGDLGFVPLSALSYTTLPEKYRSPYTPIEVLDTMAVLNDTVDTYALGLVLYQAYNGGKLPQKPQDGAALPAPEYADYEMAEIILKACAPDPKDRWESPLKMGQALVSYLQRNTVNDEPIIPPVLEPEEEDAAQSGQEPEEFLPEREPEPEELAFLQGMTFDETAPNEENTQNLEDVPVTDEASEMLAQADDLISHELPDPVVAPEAAEVPMPDPIEVPMPTISLEPQEEEADEPAPEEAPQEAPVEEEKPAQEEKPEKKPAQEGRRPNIKVLVAALLILVALVCAGMGGWYYYENIYQQNIEAITVDGTENMISVQIQSDIADEKLTVYCTDSYGNSTSGIVSAGVAVFQDLTPNTRYNIRVEIAGSHKLTGVTTSSFTTDPQVTIENFQAVIGATDGSALLSFTPSGNTGNNWVLTYSAEGIPEKTLSFVGHSVSVNDLVIGSEYTFTLSAPSNLHLTGTTETKLKAGKLMFAQDLTILACGDGVLSLSWNAPDGETVDSWTIRCYNEAGFSKTVTTSDLNYTFTEIDHTTAYTVEVFAENMSQSTYVSVGANPVTITGFQFDDTIPGLLKLTWSFTGTAPAEGWVLNYTADGLAQETLYTTETTAELYVIPGSHYAVTLQAGNDVTVFGGTATYDLPEAETFAGYGLTAETIESSMCIRPQAQYWSQADVPEEDYVNSFTADQRSGMILHATTEFETSQENVRITYLVRNSDGTLLHVGTANSLWDNIFPGEYGALNIPFMPDDAGEYTITIYFNGKFVTVQTFSII